MASDIHIISCCNKETNERMKLCAFEDLWGNVIFHFFSYTYSDSEIISAVSNNIVEDNSEKYPCICYDAVGYCG